MRRQAGVFDENEEGGCKYETVQPGRMELWIRHVASYFNS